VLFTYRKDLRLGDGRKVQVRFKTPADRKEWRHFVALVPDDSGHAPGTQLDVADLSTDYNKFDDPYMIAVVDGEIVGALFVVPLDPSMGYHMAHTIEFHMDVLPGWRRNGVGTVLLESLVNWARARDDIRKLDAVFLGWNQPVVAMLMALARMDTNPWEERAPPGGHDGRRGVGIAPSTRGIGSVPATPLGYSLNSSHRLANDSTSPSRKDLRCVRRTFATSSWLMT